MCSACSCSFSLEQLEFQPKMEQHFSYYFEPKTPSLTAALASQTDAAVVAVAALVASATFDAAFAVVVATVVDGVALVASFVILPPCVLAQQRNVSHLQFSVAAVSVAVPVKLLELSSVHPPSL